MTRDAHHALVIQEDQSLKVVDVPIPKPEKNEVLIKVSHAALNPTDWKHVEYKLAGPGKVPGCDVSGTIVAVGSDVTRFKIGDRVCAWEHGGRRDGEGAFSEHMRVSHDLVAKIPDSMPFDQAATIPLAAVTASLGLHHIGADKLPAGSPILIWAGSTSTSLYAIQIASRILNLTVITTSSPANFDLLKSLGASHTFDYKDPDVVRKIKEASGDKLTHAYDGISEHGSVLAIEAALGPSGGVICSLLGVPPEGTLKRGDVVRVDPTLAYTSFGREMDVFGSHFDAIPEDYAHASDFYRRLEAYLEEGKIVPNKVRLVEGGLEGVQKGFEIMKSGKLSAEKIVFKIEQ
ncbi:hypothetical protein HK101_008101 [Irineochytrium annulatum]|nr:hypothetical protein HK101_008101 [Irineochytrium annulatum]